jgi:hypothetical protein
MNAMMEGDCIRPLSRCRIDAEQRTCRGVSTLESNISRLSVARVMAVLLYHR